ncbi:DUF2092 domain-containing protein [Ensifer sesbaniae]|uniref:DUF2092 domain-containing protein n=1 Tax=Ensifer sesbaniae TaxID=1214071 RepID=UPI001569C551|nr:DUF2092 domain-containing protein [Ensifer sesbaniae]NRQ12804.1 hypothetical protein [Ensifer sesbaniae]
MEVCNGSDVAVLKAACDPAAADSSADGERRNSSLARCERTGIAAATTPLANNASTTAGSLPPWRALVITNLQNAVRIVGFGVCVGFAALPVARAEESVSRFKPAISDEAAAAVSQMSKTLLARDLSITAKTIRVYLDVSGQPLHIFHTMKIVVHRPNQIAVESTGDDGSHNLFYDGKSASIFFPDSKEYAVIAASGDIPSALNEVLEKTNVDYPLTGLFTNAPDKVLLSDAIAAWQVGTANVDGVECRHLYFIQKSGIDLELWVEKSKAATPHRLIVTHRSLPGQPRFIAEFTSWKTQPTPSGTGFAFRPPADAKRIELTAASAPEAERSK